MTGAVVPLSSPTPPTGDGQPRHCPAGEYEAFIAGSTLSEDRKIRLGRWHARFVRYFPDLRDWFDQPLRQRLGWRNKDTQTRRQGPGEDFDITVGWVNYNARDYLIYLALTGRLRLDWGWLLGIGVIRPWWIADHLGLPLTAQIDQLRTQVIALGHSPDSSTFRVSWTVIRLLLHRGDPDLQAVTADDVEDLRATIRTLEQVPGIEQVLRPGKLTTFKNAWGTSVFRTGLALFHTGITDRPPPRLARKSPPPLSRQPRIAAVMDRYMIERALIVRPETMSSTRQGLRRLADWIAEERPAVQSLAELARTDLLDFMTWLRRQRKIKQPDQPLSDAYRRGIISEVTVFLRYGAHAEWPDMPTRPVLTRMDVPRGIQRVPRYIPEHQLEPVMIAIRALECPLQRCALLIARWSGARRGEIRRLHLDCLDTYPDGTPRLRLAAGKSLKERTVPLHSEAAEAISRVVALRSAHADRGIYDRDIGKTVRYLFLHNGRLADSDYLFAVPLGRICDQLGILNADGKAAIHPHRFRHTLGTQLAEKGARTQTIMKILGHLSAGMSMTYSHISDPVVLADYQAVLQPGAAIAGPLADTLRRGQLDQTALDWLKTNFYKTELELGRCLRLPQEGPCECDIYLSCPKFVTTPQYIPRLQDRLRTEEELVADATERGWAREIERHRCTAERIRTLLAELGERDENHR
ncbi:tyrosine-type recombinase/integrase [Micromonospora taraxaci]|uniref:tyrosine-type recombinase/integrase n=1 Tax=Micromonospora taraxaci TaxID=1316803 RepID=UPI0033F75023